MTDNAREIVRSLVDARLQSTESLHGAAGILAARGQSIAQRAARQQQQGGGGGGKILPKGTNLGKMFGINVVSPPPTAGVNQPKQVLTGLGLKKSTVKGASSYLQKHSPPSGSPPGGLQSLQKQAKHKGPTPSNKPSWHAVKYLGRKALSPHGPIGLGVVGGIDAIAPGLGIIARGIQQSFGK